MNYPTVHDASESTRWRVFIVAGELAVALDLKQRLEGQSYAVIGTAGTGAEAIALALQARPDVVLMDLLLSCSMDDIETANELRWRVGVPLILLTALRDPATVLWAKTALPDGFLLKPCEIGQICVTIEAAIARHRAEALGRLSERALAASSLGILITEVGGPDQPIVLCNSAFERMTGYTSAEVVGRNPGFLQPDDPELLQLFRQAVAGERDCRATLINYRKDGTSFWVELTLSSVRDATGCVTHVIGTQNDITERRRQENRVQEQARLLDCARDAILVHDVEGPITYWSRGAERIYGWSAEEAVGRLASELFGNPATAKLNEINRSLQDQREWSGEIQHLTKDRRRIVVDSRLTLVASPSNGRASVLAINTDVTGRKRLAEELGRTRSLENLGAIANSVAHDLNNSLGPILMAVDLMRLQPLADPIQELIEMIDTSAREGAATVNQLLAFSKGAKGEHILLNFGNLVREVAKVVRNTYPKSLRINVTIEPDLWLITGDAAQLPQMLLCLCANARDAMPQGGSLNISVKNAEFGVDFTDLPPEACPGSYLYVEVVDTGNGIPEEELAKLFDPSAAGDPQSPGFRLGLSTAHAIVKNHGGFIRCCNKTGAGTSFQIYFPAQSRAVAEAVVDGHASKIDARGLTVLVADDEPLGRRLLKSMLQFRGFKVLEAADGTEAVALFAQHHDEIKGVFTDLIMPHMDGFQLAFAMKRMQPNVKIIVISGLPKSLWQLGNDALNVLSLLSKPFRPDELDAVLRANFASMIQAPYPPPPSEPD